MKLNEKIEFKTYEPDNVLKKGYLNIFPEIFKEISANRWLTLQLFKRDLLAMYKQSILGFLWIILLPLISVGTFVLLNRSGIFNISGINIPYPLYAILGISIWQLFSTGIIASTNSLVKSGQMIMKINFSKKSLVLASFGQAVISFFIQFALTIVLMIVFKITPSVYIFLLPLLIIPLVLLSIGLGFILSILNGIMRDFGSGISIIVTFLMFLTPVLYPRPEDGVLSVITAWNPLHFLINVPRDLIISGATTELTGYIFSSIFSVFIFFLCLFIFHISETRITERI